MSSSSPSSISSYRELGNIHYQRREYSSAILEYSKALELARQANSAEDCVILYSNLAAAELNLQRVTAALHYSSKAIELFERSNSGQLLPSPVIKSILRSARCHYTLCSAPASAPDSVSYSHCREADILLSRYAAHSAHFPSDLSAQFRELQSKVKQKIKLLSTANYSMEIGEIAAALKGERSEAECAQQFLTMERRLAVDDSAALSALFDSEVAQRLIDGAAGEQPNAKLNRSCTRLLFALCSALGRRRSFPALPGWLAALSKLAKLFKRVSQSINHSSLADNQSSKPSADLLTSLESSLRFVSLYLPLLFSLSADSSIASSIDDFPSLADFENIQESLLAILQRPSSEQGQAALCEALSIIAQLSRSLHSVTALFLVDPSSSASSRVVSFPVSVLSRRFRTLFLPSLFFSPNFSLGRLDSAPNLKSALIYSIATITQPGLNQTQNETDKATDNGNQSASEGGDNEPNAAADATFLLERELQLLLVSPLSVSSPESRRHQSTVAALHLLALANPIRLTEVLKVQVKSESKQGDAQNGEEKESKTAPFPVELLLHSFDYWSQHSETSDFDAASDSGTESAARPRSLALIFSVCCGDTILRELIVANPAFSRVPNFLIQHLAAFLTKFPAPEPNSNLLDPSGSASISSSQLCSLLSSEAPHFSLALSKYFALGDVTLSTGQVETLLRATIRLLILLKDFVPMLDRRPKSALDSLLSPLPEQALDRLAQEIPQLNAAAAEIARMAVEAVAFASMNVRIKSILCSPLPAEPLLSSLLPIEVFYHYCSSLDSTIRFGLVNLFRHLTQSAEEIQREYSEEVRKLRQIAQNSLGGEQAKKEEFVRKRAGKESEILPIAKKAVEKGLASGLTAIVRGYSGGSEDSALSLPIACTIASSLLVLAADSGNRGLLAQQGAIKLLLTLHSIAAAQSSSAPAAASPSSELEHQLPANTPPRLSHDSILASARLLISINPASIPDEQLTSLLAPLLRLLTGSTHELTSFESLLALTNAASHSAAVADQLTRLNAWSEARTALGESNPMLQRAALQLMTNLLSQSTLLQEALHSAQEERSKSDKLAFAVLEEEDIRLFLAFASSDDLATAEAATACLAIASGVPRVARAIGRCQLETRVDEVMMKAAQQIRDRTLEGAEAGEVERLIDQAEQQYNKSNSEGRTTVPFARAGLVVLRSLFESADTPPSVKVRIQYALENLKAAAERED